jgi:hypothetical protein
VRVATVVTLRELGHLAEEHGDIEVATRYQEESLELARRLGEPRLVARTLEGVAGALSLGKHPDEAARLIGLAEATRASVDAPLPDGEREDLLRVTTRLRDRLGEERFGAEVALGREEFVPPARPHAVTPR